MKLATQLISRSRFLIQKLKVSQLIRKFPFFVVREDLLAFSQDFSYELYSVLHKSSLQRHIYSIPFWYSNSVSHT